MTENPALLQRLFGKPALSEVDEGLLMEMIREYPYFAHARWALAAKHGSASAGTDAVHKASAFAYHSLRLESYLAAHRNGNSLNGSVTEAAAPVPEDILAGASWASAADAAETEPGTVIEATAAATGGTDETHATGSAAGPGEITGKPADEAADEVHGGDAGAPPAGRWAETDEESAEQPAANEVPPPGEDAADTANGQTLPEGTPLPLIQPLFTEDYFAYTGATLPEVVDNDKKPTMEQLHSFTDWLRTMKRPKGSPDPDLDNTPDPGPSQEEKDLDAVTASANASIRAESEVYTEAMAEVRISAGQPDKAAAIYEKLKLHYPEKSSYFAQKIADLKSK